MIIETKMINAQLILAYQYFQPYDDPDEDMGYVKPTEIRSIIPPMFSLGVNFDIISAII